MMFLRVSGYYNAMTILILVASGFAATNLDNFLLLVGWMLSGRASSGRLLIAYAIAVVAVLLASLAFGLSANAIPVNYIGYLGLVPVVLGLKLLADQLRGRSQGLSSQGTGGFSVGAIATTWFSNSVDTMLVFAPLLADSNATTDRTIVPAYLAMAVAWFLAARLFSKRAARLRRVVMAAQWLTPLIMIAIGFYILDNTLTDVIPGA
jgi:cadmium resistance protein CadD (predicted permease)